MASSVDKRDHSRPGADRNTRFDTMSGDGPARRGSAASTTSHASRRSDQTQKPGTPSHIPLLRQTSVSMFTGKVDLPPASPTSESLSSALSPGSIDRVFPIRSVVSVDPHATPMVRQESGDEFPDLRLSHDSGIAARREQNRVPADNTSSQGAADKPHPGRRKSTHGAEEHIPQDGRRRTFSYTNSDAEKVDNRLITGMMGDASDTNSIATSGAEPSAKGASKPASVLGDEQGLFTARFKHIVTDGGHAVITGRDGETLQRCEDEPIHIPGAVQSFGLLIAIKEEDGKLAVRVASENSAGIIGYSPSQLFALDNFLDIFTEEQADNLLDHLDFIRDGEAADVVSNGPEVFMISVRPPQHRTRKLWCAMHVADSNRDLVICEFEVEDDQVNPLVPVGAETPEPPEDTLGSDPTPAEYAESTVNISKPLRVLRTARKKRGEAAAMEVFNIMSQVQEQMADAPNLEVFLRVLIGVVKELSGFHRVMIYQFDHTFNGRVVAELVDPRATKDLYKGLHFPASDIPKQARELYKINKVRLLYDRDQETARLVCRTMEDLDDPVDMTHAYLRALSPIHIKYLRNMAVRSSMSISINAFGELWGLIACHTYGSKGMRVSFPIRKMCRLVGDTASRNIERLSYASRLQARKLINTTSSAANPSGYIVASSDDLLRLFDADVGALSIRDETKIMGNPQGHLQEMLAVVEFMRMRKLNCVSTTHDIKMDFPDFRYAPGLKHVAGLLYVPLANGGSDFICFFRKGSLQEVKWAGNPYEKFVKEGTEGYLEPRKSFKTWSETIVGRCRDWTQEEVETASVLCLVYGKFIEVWRQKEAAMQNSQLTRLLLANSAHEVRTPLNHIINYLEIALEGTLDQDTRENLSRSHSASKSLVYVINDLLDLTKTEGGRDLVIEEPFNLVQTLTEATSPFVGDAKRKGITYTINIDPAIPHAVVGDPRRIRQVISNLVANAVQHTATGEVKVEAFAVPEPSEGKFELEIIVEDTGAGMSQAKVDALFRELEEVSYETDMADMKMLEEDPFSDSKGSDSSEGDGTTLGLGLAVVARTIRTMDGQLRLKTEEGKGSRFVIQLGLAEDQTSKTIASADAPLSLPFASPTKNSTPPAAVAGEFLLIDRNTVGSIKRPTTASSSMARKPSLESMNSLISVKSGKSQTSLHSTHSNKSDADRLIDAIQEPLRLNRGDDSIARPDSSRSGQHQRSYFGDISPSAPQKARSIGSANELKSAFARTSGEHRVTDSGTPVKAVRMPEEIDESHQRRPSSRVVFEEPERITNSPSQASEASTLSSEGFTVLVAEDDPINSKIMKKRLERLGHSPTMTVNGEECSSAYGEQASSYDAVLMDLQVSSTSYTILLRLMTT